MTENNGFDREGFMDQWGIVEEDVCILTESEMDDPEEETLEAVIYE